MVSHSSPEERGGRWFEALRQDVRHGARVLARHPLSILLTIATLGLGIGANTAIFSVVNGVLLKPLPYADGDRLVLLRESAPLAGQPQIGISIQELYDYRRQLPDFEGLVEFHQMSFDLLNQGEPDRVDTGVVSANFFDVLGVAPVLGRTFADEDDDEGAEPVLVLSHAYWQSRFGGDPNIVGRVFEMNDRAHTVIGVLPAVPHYPNECDVYMPTSACPFRAAAERQPERRRGFAALEVFGRLKPGVAPERAADTVSTVASRFRLDHPDVYREGLGFGATAVPLRDELTRQARPILLLLLATTGLILLLSCANVANLMLARLLNREREIALRAALGAGRGRLIRQMLTESALVAVAGGAAGLVFAWLTLDALGTFVGRFTVRTGEIGLDPIVLVFTLIVSVATGLAFGAFPAWAAQPGLASALRQGGAQSGAAPSRRRLQGALVVAQVAASVVLLVGAGLLLSSVFRLQQVDPGYRPERVLSAEVYGNFTRYRSADDLRRLYLPLLERLEGQPGVLSAAVTNGVPLSAQQPFTRPFEIEGRRVDDPARRPAADLRIASPGYFRTLAIPLHRGRTFTDLDHEDAPPVVVINAAMARFWETGDPIGSRVSFDSGTTWLTVVGVVGDVKQFGLDREAVAQVYTPLRQTPVGLAGRVLVRTSGDPVSLAGTVRDAVRSIDPAVPVENVRTLEDLRNRHLATPRLTAALLSLFAGLALVVTLAGLTGVLATSVSQRTREFGLRMALGARRADVLRSVVVQGLRLVALGLAIGVGLALASGRALSAYLYGTEPGDPLTIAAVTAAFLAAGALACLGPARRATAIDPMVALRSE